jgi:hypothetical protein
VTKRQRKTRIRELVADLMTRLKNRFPDAELVSVEEWPTGLVVLHVYTRHEDGGDLIEAVLDRVTEILVEDELSIAILPERKKSAKQAA